MTVREKLEAYYASKGLGSPDGWFAMVVFGKRVRLFPLGPLQPLLMLHDLHHMLSGYDSTVGGEAQVIAWEIGSGGFGKYWFAWMDFLKIVALALFFPVRFRAAWIRGRQFRNLYTEDIHELLDWQWHALVARVDPSSSIGEGPAMV